MDISFLVIAIVAMLVLFFAMSAVGKFQTPKFVSVKIGNATVNAEVADNEAKQVRGLMFRDSLPKNDGMLFVFSGTGKHGIWMMNTKIPLDTIWLDKSRKVVDIKENAQPCDALAICPSFSPKSDDMYVLEVNAGYSEKNGIKIGSIAKWSG